MNLFGVISTERLFKSKVLLKIVMMKKETVDGQEQIKQVNTVYTNINGKELQRQIEEQEGNFPIVEVNEAPRERVQFGTFYVLKGGHRVWLYTLKEDDTNE